MSLKWAEGSATVIVIKIGLHCWFTSVSSEAQNVGKDFSEQVSADQAVMNRPVVNAIKLFWGETSPKRNQK